MSLCQKKHNTPIQYFSPIFMSLMASYDSYFFMVETGKNHVLMPLFQKTGSILHSNMSLYQGILTEKKP